ncbi:MAG TPA: hypothetical protein VGE75_06365 [Acidimicrobiales bacterium]
MTGIAPIGNIAAVQMVGDLPIDLGSEEFVDVIFEPLYNRVLIRNAPLTESYGNEPVDQDFRTF